MQLDYFIQDLKRLSDAHIAQAQQQGKIDGSYIGICNDKLWITSDIIPEDADEDPREYTTTLKIKGSQLVVENEYLV